MGSLFGDSMSTDPVDKFNHKWMVLLFVVLSAASFIIPLHPSYQPQAEVPTSTSQALPIEIKKVLRAEKLPNYKVSCWCPTHFTASSVDYVNTFCKKGFLAGMRGEKTRSVYHVPIDQNIPIHGSERKFLSIAESRKKYFKKETQENIKKEEHNNKRKEEVKSRVQKLVTFQTPIMLVVAALCLTLPHVIWSFLSACCSPFNVDETLTSANEAANTKSDCDDLSESISSAVKSCPKTVSILYLTKKVFSVVIAIALLILVCQHAVREVEKLEEDIDSVGSSPGNGIRNADTRASKTISKEEAVVNGTSPPDEIVTSPPDVNGTSPPDVNGASQLKDNVFLCDFSIRQMTRSQRYTVQCVVLEEEKEEKEEKEEVTEPNVERQPVTSVPMSRPLTNEKNLVEFESVMFKIVTAVLVILVVGNLLSLCSWLAKLLSSSSRNSIGLSSHVAMDVVFLVQMARLNANASVVRRLAQNSTGVNVADFNEMTDKE